MPLTPEDVRKREFRLSFRGYNEDEVDAFLDEVEVELARLHKENGELQQHVRTLQAAPPAPAPSSEADEMLRRTLLLAQRTADETVATAQSEAERVVGDARAQASGIVQQAQAQAAASVGDLERRQQALEQQIEGLRAFEREYRTRLKAYLEAQLRDLDGRATATADPAAGASTAAGSVPGGQPAAAPPVTGTAPATPPAAGEASGVPESGSSGGEVPRVAP